MAGDEDSKPPWADEGDRKAAWEEAERRAVSENPNTRLDEDWMLAVADLEMQHDPSAIKVMLASAEVTQYARALLVDLFERRAIGKKLRGRKHPLYWRDKFWERTIAHYVDVRREQLTAQVAAARAVNKTKLAIDLVEKEATLLEDVAREFDVSASTIDNLSRSKHSNYERDRRRRSKK